MLLELAGIAGRIAREGFATVRRSDGIAKGARDYVSHVDRRIETELIARIRSRYPDHRVLGEEGGGDAELGDGPCWIIDPLDGTSNFLHGIPCFAVSIAFCDARVEPRHALVLDPLRQEHFIAERGAGMWLGDQRVSTSGCADLGQALIATGLPFRVIEPLDDALRVFAELQRRCDDHRRGGSAALDLAYVAVGRLDAYWELGIHPWDTAAGELLVRCAGGAATDFHGATGGLAGRRSLVAGATPVLHGEILAAMAPLIPWLERPPYRR